MSPLKYFAAGVGLSLLADLRFQRTDLSLRL